MPDSETAACPKRQAFDALAPRWDSLKPDEAVAAGVERGLALLGSLSGADVVDLGCGTGRLESVLLPRLGEGTIVAVDFSPAMIEQASRRCDDSRLTWLCRDVLATAGGIAAAIDDQRLLERVAHPLARIERAIGVLEDDLHLRPQLCPLGGRGRGEVDAVDRQ